MTELMSAGAGSQASAAVPRAAATVLMLRDLDAGLEVFMIKRHEKSGDHAGSYVFPGGKVDPDDVNHAYPVGPVVSWAELRQRLNEPTLDESSALALYAAAIRETFEESGVLFARSNSPADVPVATKPIPSTSPFSIGMRSANLTLMTEALLPWSRWITPLNPVTSVKRFDTRFFVAEAPPNQVARHDSYEASDSVWITPRAALEMYWQREIVLAAPQIMSLAHLARHRCVASVLDEAKSRPPCLVLPRTFQEDGLRGVAYPGDAQHDEPRAALPGPTRLVMRGTRLEPVDGFAALFT